MIRLVADGGANEDLYMRVEGPLAGELDRTLAYWKADWPLVEVAEQDTFTILYFTDADSARFRPSWDVVSMPDAPAGPIASRVSSWLLSLALHLVRCSVTRQHAKNPAPPECDPVAGSGTDAGEP
jgi:hypothetical protein